MKCSKCNRDEKELTGAIPTEPPGKTNRKWVCFDCLTNAKLDAAIKEAKAQKKQVKK